MNLRIGSLCSGYGGLDMAVMDVLPDAEIAWHAQYEPPDKNGKPDVHQWAAQILELRFPGVPNHGDITAIDYSQVEPVDILTAGFPCQDISLAGGRAGLLAGNRSGLWSHVARAVAELCPSLVFIENVRSLTSAKAHSDLESCPRCVGDAGDKPVLRALGAVLGDLADLRFDAEWICVPASGVGACHKRERAFVLAWPAAEDPDVAAGGERRFAASGQAEGGGSRSDAGGRGGAPVPDAESQRRGQGRTESAGQPGRPGTVGDRGAPADAPGQGLETRREGRPGGGAGFGPYAAAVARHEHAFGRVAPSPLNERGRLSPRFVEWMMGLPADWVTDVPGIPPNAQLKALGNGVVPQQGAAAFRLLVERMAAGPVLADSAAPAAPLLQPLFEEIPVPPSIRPPLGAPKSWERIIVARAQLQCECAGLCGVAHKQAAGRCPRRHEGRHNRKTTLLVVAPRPELLTLPPSQAAALPDNKLMAWCGECETRAKKAAAGPGK